MFKTIAFGVTWATSAIFAFAAIERSKTSVDGSCVWFVFAATVLVIALLIAASEEKKK